MSADQTITLDVKIELRGSAPGVAAGGVLVQQVHSLHVECLIGNIPESIRVNVAELQIDQSIKVADLKLPEGVKVKNDPESIIVQVSKKVEEAAAPAAAAPAAEAAEPEVIGRAKEAESEEEEKEKK